MRYDTFCMAAAVSELQTTCSGLFLDRIHQPDELALTLHWTGAGRRHTLLIDCDAHKARVHLTALKRANPQTPRSFCALLRSRLEGARLTAVRMPRFDRILALELTRGEEEHRLVIEIMGRHSNCILVDSSGIIRGALKRAPATVSRVRQVLPGLPYLDPPADRPDPLKLDRMKLSALIQDCADAKCIVSALGGFGPFAAEEALALGASPGEGVMHLLERVRKDQWKPVVLFDGDGAASGLWAWPPEQAINLGPVPQQSMGAACDLYFQSLETAGAGREERARLSAALNRAVRSAAARAEDARADVAAGETAEELRIRGELLQSAPGADIRGRSEILLPNCYDPEASLLKIALDPLLDLRENSTAYFRRRRKSIAAAAAALQRLPELEQSLQELQSLQHRLEAAAPDELEELSREMRDLGLLKEGGEAASATAAQAKSQWPQGVRIRRREVAGWEILYGENATSNDHLTTRVAKPNDLWLHARAVTGAHVVVRGVGDLQRLPRAVLLEAAAVAARHSDAKHASHVPVDYTFRRYVRKPRRSAPGAVTYTHEKTLHVEPGLGT